MGRGEAGFHASRAEFLSDETLHDGLKYSRNGGCFVTTKKAIAFVVVALLSLGCVIVLMYYYGPNTRVETLVKETTSDIEQLINETIKESIPKEGLRLPTNLQPLNYRLWVHPILEESEGNNFTFTGRVKILVKCIEETDKIVLNVDDLNITLSSITVSTTQQVEVVVRTLESTTEPEHNVTKRNIKRSAIVSLEDHNEEIVNSESETTINEERMETTVSTIENTEPVYEAVTETAIITTEVVPLAIKEVNRDEENFKLNIILDGSLAVDGTYTIDIKFSGLILNNLVGLYRTSYTDLSGNVKWLATTHFESVYARRVFPCFDEPLFKASFEISIARRTNMTSLSNMPLRDIEPMNDTEGWVWDHFMKSPPMSTYLVAFTICDFESISANVSLGPVLKIWAPKDDLDDAQYALEVVQEILPFLENYFGIKYPLPKLDLIAIPSFGKEAMENWGFIYFRKSLLLFDKKSRSIKTKSVIFAKIAHELTHQWFGNLVTMEWWSDLWLNEGFGIFMAEVTLSSLRPRWHAFSILQLRDVYTTLYLDSLKSTHSIQSDITNTAQIEQLFESRIYQKGSSVLKMLNFTITRDVFRKGLQDYLKKFSYKSTTQDDLWEIFTTTAHNESVIPHNVTVEALMNSWTTQSGYPYVTITRNYTTEEALLNQTKMDGEGNVTSDTLWFIPITYTTKDDGQVKNIWLKQSEEILMDLNGTSNDSWVLLNIDQTGFYRVNYDLYNWHLLQYQLIRNPNKIPVANRGQLIDDAFQLAKAGIINYTIAFDLVNYLTIKETNYIPWYSALINMEELRVIISNYEYSGLYDNFLLKLVQPVFDEMGTKERPYDTQNEKLLRLHVVKSACKLRYGKCITWARNQFYEWMELPNPDEKNPIPVDYRFIVQCAAIKAGGPLEWDYLWNRTLSPSISPGDLETAYYSLGCTYDPWLINRYLEYSLVGNISLEGVPFVWKSINHPVGVRTGFQFLRLNWERIYDTYEDVYLVFSTIFHDFVSQLSTEIDLEDLTTFYKLHQNDLKSVSTILQGTVDQMKVRINWKKKHLASVVDWLKRNKF